MLHKLAQVSHLVPMYSDSHGVGHVSILAGPISSVDSDTSHSVHRAHTRPGSSSMTLLDCCRRLLTPMWDYQLPASLPGVTAGISKWGLH